LFQLNFTRHIDDIFMLLQKRILNGYFFFPASKQGLSVAFWAKPSLVALDPRIDFGIVLCKGAIQLTVGYGTNYLCNFVIFKTALSGSPVALQEDKLTGKPI
jgi:hypothetical protein